MGLHYSFAGISREDFLSIKAMIIEKVTSINHVVESSPAQALYALNIDFFEDCKTDSAFE